LNCLVLGSIVLLVNLGHYQRNYRLFHNPLHSGNDDYGNGRLTPAVLLSNLSRNAALHLLTPSTGANDYLITALNLFHNTMGIAWDDPDTTWPGMSPGSLFFNIHEDFSGNFLHICLFMTFIPLLAVNRNFRKNLPYAVSVIAGFLLFCILLRWQPWASRLQLPLFVLFSPLAGVVVPDQDASRATTGLMVIFSLAALPYLLCNSTRPVISLPHYPPSIFTPPRWVLYFTNEPNRGMALLDALNAIRNGGFKNIGVKSGGDTWEYPLWALSRDRGVDGPRIEHLDVRNVSQAIPRRPFIPDIIVVFNDDGSVTLELPQNRQR